ncbi:MAG: lysophospholipid acyltransferase family protein [Planctomycetota bacterium]
MENCVNGAPGKFVLGGAAGAAFLLSIGSTWRIDYRGYSALREIRGRGHRPIYTLWHGRLLPLAYTHRRRRVTMLVSEHGDGEFIAQIIKRLGYRLVRGSSTRGWIRAAKQIVSEAKEYDLGITPDGPKGPRHIMQAGAIYIAMKTGNPLVPITASASFAWAVKSWDRFLVPYPGASVLVRWGEPYYVPPALDSEGIETHREEYEKILRELTDSADAEAGLILEKA